MAEASGRSRSVIVDGMRIEMGMEVMLAGEHPQRKSNAHIQSIARLDCEENRKSTPCYWHGVGEGKFISLTSL
jgi:hypothetical protein